MILQNLLPIVIGLLVQGLLAGYFTLRIRKEYQTRPTRPWQTVLIVWLLFSLQTGLVIYAAFNPIYQLPIARSVAVVGGGLVAIFGLGIAIGGFVEFRSLRRMSGMAADKLITSGVYRLSRNPQNVGWGLLLLGVALLGRSPVALALAILYGIAFRAYIVKEEQHLAQVFPEQWAQYSSTTPRFLGWPPASERPIELTIHRRAIEQERVQ